MRGGKAQKSVKARAHSSLLHSDVLGMVMRIRPASGAVMEELMQLKLVCKYWKEVAELAAADKIWLGPWHAKGLAFLAGIPLLVWQMNSTIRRCSPPEALVLRRSFLDQVQEHVFDAPVLCRALRGLVEVEGYRYPEHIPTGEVAALIRRALQAHPADLDVVARASKLLCVIAEIRDGQDALLDAGLAPVLMAALARRKPCIAVVDAIVALVYVKNTSHVNGHLAVVQARVVPLLIEAMCFNYADVPYQIASLRCVRVLCRYHPHAVLFKNEGVGGVIFRFMDLHVNNRAGQGAALNALVSLEAVQTPGEGIDFFADTCGMLRVLAGACKCATRENHLQAMRVVDHLQDKTRATTERLLEMQVVRYVLYVMKIHPWEPVMQTASRVLDRLSSHQHFARQPQASEVPQKVLAMIEAYPDNATLQRHARRMKARFQRRDKQASA
jgi:hypothetical protein